ncbi:MAG: hypothetical protein QM770_01865 [Tepidisphaeraceae bacterium]
MSAEEDANRLLDAFYAWELRGRGWFLWDDPVSLEPPYRPFLRLDPSPDLAADDGRHHSLLSGIFARLHDWSHGRFFRRGAAPRSSDIDEPAPAGWNDHGQAVEFLLTLPRELDVSPATMAAFLNSIASVRGPVSFELIGSADVVVLCIGCGERSADSLGVQLAAHFPEAVVTRTAGRLGKAWESGGDHQSVVECGLMREFMLPIATPTSFNVDPLLGVVGAIADARSGEAAVLQVMFEPARCHWGESVLRAVTLSDGEAFFAGAGRDYVKGRRERCRVRSTPRSCAWRPEVTGGHG